VTGGFGFIGSHFVEQQVLAGNRVRIWDALTYAATKSNLPNEILNEIVFERIDISESMSVHEASNVFNSVDWIVNFAAESHVDQSIVSPEKFVMTNVYGTVNLLNLVRQGKAARFLQISTDEVYGSITQGTWEENNLLDPRSPYSASKASAEHFVNAYAATYNCPSIITRCANNYGPRQSMEKLIPKIIWKILNHQAIPIYGDGLNQREWIHVSQHVQILSRLIDLTDSAEGVFNISGIEKSNLEIVRTVGEIMGINEPEINFVQDRLGHDRRYSMSDKKLHGLMNVQETPEFFELLESTVKWYLDNPKWINESFLRLNS
jgi:dTDP-glucose 4,6-dehydratase